MNTFLPFSDFNESAKVLDDARLRKQAVEAWSILETNLGVSGAWSHHPAVLMWQGSERRLCDYGLAMVEECGKRQFSIRLWDKFNEVREFLVFNCCNSQAPFWLGDERLHRSHRSRLLFKGRLDAVCYSIRRFLKLTSINDWLSERGYPLKNVLKHCHILELERFAQLNNIPVEPNHYHQYKWQLYENDEEPYFWPVKFGRVQL